MKELPKTFWGGAGVDSDIRRFPVKDIDPYQIKQELVDSFGVTVLVDTAKILAQKGLTPESGQIFTVPHTHNEDREEKDWSEAIYLADYLIPGEVNEQGEPTTDRVMVSFFRKVEDAGEIVDQFSSSHDHTTDEIYKKGSKKGEVTLILNGEETLELKDEFHVIPGTLHQVRAKGPALVIIHLKGAGDKPDSELHRFRQDAVAA